MWFLCLCTRFLEDGMLESLTQRMVFSSKKDIDFLGVIFEIVLLEKLCGKNVQ